MGATEFLAGLASGFANHYATAQERKREEERQRRQMGINILSGALGDDTLPPEAHNYILEKLFDEAGIPKSEQTRMIGSVLSMSELMKMMRGAPAPAGSTPSFAGNTSNTITLEPGEWREPAPAPERPAPKLLPAPQVRLGGEGIGGPEPTAVSSLLPEVPGLAELRERNPGRFGELSAQARVARQDAPTVTTTNAARGPLPSAEELERLGDALRSKNPPPAFSPLQRPDNYESLSKYHRGVVDRILKQQQETFDREMNELGDRLRIMGGSYTEGRDKRLDELVTKYGASPKRGGGGGGMNPQKIRNASDGSILYFDSLETHPIVLYKAGMTEEEKLRNAINLANINAQRTRNGDEPLMFAADLPTLPGGQSTPANVPPMSGASKIPDVPGASTVPPVPGASGSPLLISVPGAKKTTPLFGRGRGGRGRGGYSGGGASSRRDSIGESLELRDAARYRSEAAQAKAQASAARSRGEEETALAYDESARVAEQNARLIESRRGARTPVRPDLSRVGAGAAATISNDPLGIRRKRQ